MSIPQLSEASAALVPATAGADRVSELQARIHGMQRDRWETGGRTLPGTLARLLPGGMLRTGVVYSIENSTSLIMAVLAAAADDGAWSAVVGLPDFGTEAALGFGLDLERLVLVPSPGDQWMAVTAALVDVLPLVVVRPERAIGDAEAARLGARLRQSRCTLIIAGVWSQTEAHLRVDGTRWDGLGVGHGYLSGRDLTVQVSGRNDSDRRLSELVHLPDRGTPEESPSAPAATLRHRNASGAPARRRGHPAAG